MSGERRGRPWLLACSLTLNILILASASLYIAHKGGIGFVLRLTGLEKTQFQPLPFQERMEAFQSKLPINPPDTVFLGDSLTADAPYADYFTTIKKRGVGGETTAAVLGRLKLILDKSPAKLFVMIGTNDLCKDIPLDEIVGNYRQILDQTSQISPATSIYVIGVTPINAKIQGAAYDASPQVPVLNRRLEAICSERHIPFIDPCPVLADATGQLKAEYTTDGLHLTAEGYAQLIPLLARYQPGVSHETSAATSPAQ